MQNKKQSGDRLTLSSRPLNGRESPLSILKQVWVVSSPSNSITIPEDELLKILRVLQYHPPSAEQEEESYDVSAGEVHSDSFIPEQIGAEECSTLFDVKQHLSKKDRKTYNKIFMSDFYLCLKDCVDTQNPMFLQQASEEELKERRKAKMRGWVPVFIIVIVLIIVFRCFVFNSFVPSSSMENTLMPGDRIFSSRIQAQDVHRYDILIFKAPDDPSVYYVKRVIGLPGDTIDIKTDGHVYINGKVADESFLKEPMKNNHDATYNVPKDCYFMMGDNRNNSEDSRFWENTFLPKKNIKAKNGVVYWPLKHAKVIGENK